MLELYALIGAGDIWSLTPSVTGSLRLASIRVYDKDMNHMNQLTGFYYQSQSGASYNVEGATQIPEPSPALGVIVALLLLIFRGSVVRCARRS